MNIRQIGLIAFKQFENLGMGYLASVLSKEGYETHIIDPREGKEEIFKKIKIHNPLVVGFSVIFLYHIIEFKELIEYLRSMGIKCHFTAGGHYASLRYEELFKQIPSLDSVVRFEGEYTFLDLIRCIDSGKDWRNIKSIAFRQDGKTFVNSLRPLEKNLDNFPIPVRDPVKDYLFRKKFTTLLAGRGCVHDCIYCDIRGFYKTPGGPVKRLRKPESVVMEMELLQFEQNCSVFFFQDDDFPVRTKKGSEWIERFCNELMRKNLHDKIIWKINCRPDEIDMKSFRMMKNQGLFLVFLGIEDGTDKGLSRMNKNMTVAKSLAGINILKKLNIGFDYGFMLFQPWSTFVTVKENLDFLRKICKDGFTPVTYLKMLPFFGTRIERELKDTGRIKGEPGFLDYDFLDNSLNHYYEFTTGCFMEWLKDPNGLLDMIKWARNYLAVFSRYYQITPEVISVSENVTRVTSESNLFFLDTMNDLALIFRERKNNRENYRNLGSYKSNIKARHDYFNEQIKNCISRLVNIAAVQELERMISN